MKLKNVILHASKILHGPEVVVVHVKVAMNARVWPEQDKQKRIIQQDGKTE